MNADETPRLDEIQTALDAGDIDRVRRALIQVEGRERSLLIDEMGEAALPALGAPPRAVGDAESWAGCYSSLGSWARNSMRSTPKVTLTASG